MNGKMICNTGPIVALSTIDRIDILRHLFELVAVPEAVHKWVNLGSGFPYCRYWKTVREKNIMSRSRRKTPMRGITTAESEKKDKQLANQKERHRNRQLLGYFLDETLLMHRRQAGDPWLMDKDGKAFFNPEKYPELMRK